MASKKAKKLNSVKQKASKPAKPLKSPKPLKTSKPTKTPKLSAPSKTSKISKQNNGKEKQTRVEILRSLAENTGLTKNQVESLFASLTEMIISHVCKKGSGEFTIPMTGIKVRRVKKKATKSRKMLSPLTGQEVVIPGKPARNAIKISALKVLKTAAAE